MYVIHGAIVKYNQLYKIAVITLCLWGAFPSSIALFPQTGSISAQSVEPEFQAIKEQSESCFLFCIVSGPASDWHSVRSLQRGYL